MRSLTSLLVAALLGAVFGCSKPAEEKADSVNQTAPVAPAPPAPAPLAQPPATPPNNVPLTPPAPKQPEPKQPEPKQPEPAKPHPLGGKVSTVDLSPHRVRAVIDIPEGETLKRFRGGPLYIEYGEARTVSGSTLRDFSLQISRIVGNFTFDKAKDNDRFDGMTVNADAADRYFFSEQSKFLSKYKMGRVFTTGDQSYYVHFSCVTGSELTKEMVQPIWRAIESLRQTEAQQKAEVVRTATLKKFLRKDADPESFIDQPYHYGFDDDLVVYLQYEVITPENVRLLKDIPDLYTVRLVGYEKFDKKLFQEILDLPTVRGVWLDGDWVTDEVLALATANPRITDVTLIRVAATDKGFASLEKLPKLRMVSLEFCEKITPEATKTLKAKYPKLEFTNLR
jgi:hypothetical protein